jgi:flagellar basal body-associated protein FliL
MPGWIWVLLVLFMIGMIIAGGIYAFLKAKGALSTLGGLGSHVQKAMEAMSTEPEAIEAHAPAVTDSLAQTAQRYEEAHTARLEHKQMKRNRHVATWRRWDRFNTLDDKGGNR